MFSNLKVNAQTDAHMQLDKTTERHKIINFARDWLCALLSFDYNLNNRQQQPSEWMNVCKNKTETAGPSKHYFISIIIMKLKPTKYS